MTSRYLQLFRALLPSWRFFENIAPTPTLWVRIASSGSDAWKECRLSISKPRTVVQLLNNAEENFSQASRALLRQLLDDIEDGSDRRVSLALVETLAAAQLEPTRCLFQFKVKVGEEDRFLSPVIAWPR